MKMKFKIRRLVGSSNPTDEEILSVMKDIIADNEEEDYWRQAISLEDGVFRYRTFSGKGEYEINLVNGEVVFEGYRGSFLYPDYRCGIHPHYPPPRRWYPQEDDAYVLKIKDIKIKLNLVKYITSQPEKPLMIDPEDCEERKYILRVAEYLRGLEVK